MEDSENFFEDFQHIISELTPENFLNVEESSVKNNLKTLYDFVKKQEKKFANSNGLPSLLIKNFDVEQIWQEIELQNDKVLSKALHIIPKFVVNKEKLIFSNLNGIEHHEEESEHHEEESEHHEEESEHHEEESEHEDVEEQSDTSLTNKLLDNQDNDSEIEDEQKNSIKEGAENYSSKKTSIVDDEFFKLDEMENFLKTEEKKEQHGEKKLTKELEDAESDDEEEEGSIDLFEAESDEENDKTRTAKFKDFFRPSVPTEQKKPKRNKFLEEMQEPSSTLELRQERFKQKIEELEENAISEKPWTLKGEILAENRPQNSLLEEILEFDMTSRPAPVITETTTMQLDDIIKQRIKDKAFDSVVRKEKPIQNLLEFKKKLTLDQEKSKHSLAQIYEKEYLEQQAALNPTDANKDEEEPALHKEIKIMMRDLFNKLDALSNFHFTPKPALPELRIVNNLPAISMEEVAPVTSNEASLLAPEEIRNKLKGDILGDSEKTKTDKKRERRKKKIKQKKHKQLISKNMLTNNKRPNNKMTEVFKQKNTQKLNENSKAIKSSKAFFSQLQEQAKAHIGKTVRSLSKHKEKNTLDARKLKL